MQNHRLTLPVLSAVLAVGLVCLPGNPVSSAGAQSSSSQQQVQEIQQPLRVGVSLVSLFATVRDKDKRIIPDLKQEDFRIFEDDKEEKIEFFSRETSLPLTFGMLIDTSGSQRGVLGAEQEMGSRFLRQVLRKKDLAFVFSFDLNVDMLQDFTGDTGELERALYRARINAPNVPLPVQGPVPLGPQGTRFYDAIYLACKERLASEVGRKALVILTDADDYGSKLTLQDAIDAALRSDTVVHIIGISDGRFLGAGAAKKISEQTGGRTIYVNSEKQLEQAFEQISEELRSQYTLGYYPSNKAKDGNYRKIRVETTRKDSKVLTRKGYYAPKN